MRARFAVTALIVLGLATPALARIPKIYYMTEPVVDESTLPKAALEPYSQAMREFDHVDLDDGIELLSRAAEKAPDNAQLQLLTANRSLLRALVYYGAASYTPPKDGNESIDYASPPWRTAEVFLDFADAPLQRLLSDTELSTEDREDLETMVAQYEALRSTLAERDAQRIETARPLVMKIRADREKAMKGGEDKLELLDPRNALEEKGAEQAEVAAAGEGQEGTTDLVPFRELPGQYIQPFLPPTPAAPQGGGYNGVYGGNPYGVQDPFAASGAGGFGDPNVDPAMAYDPVLGPGGAGGK